MKSGHNLAAEYLPHEDLRPFEANPRTWHLAALEKLARSLLRFGWARPVVCQAGTLTICAGNRSWHAARLALERWPDDARAAGLHEVPVRVLDWDNATAHAYAIADNRHGDDGRWDEEAEAALILQILEETADEAGELAAMGYDAAEIAALLEEEEEEATKAAGGFDPRVPEEPPAAPQSAYGEIYRLGPHWLLCGDSTKRPELARLLEAAGIDYLDAVIEDPPYAIYGSSTGVTSSIMDDAIVLPFFRALLEAAQGSVKMFGHVYIFCDWRSWPSIWAASKGLNLTPKNALVWDKGDFGMGSNYGNCYELAAYLANLPREGSMKSGTRRGQRTANRGNIFRFPRPTGEDRAHNAAKPSPLIEELLKHATDEGESVGDFFAGSGQTMLAADRCGRVAVLVEKSPGWCDVIRQRWGAYCEAVGKPAGPDALK